MKKDRLLEELNLAWAEEDDLRPDAPPGPRHSEGLYDLTGNSPGVQWTLWRFIRHLVTGAALGMAFLAGVPVSAGVNRVEVCGRVIAVPSAIEDWRIGVFPPKGTPIPAWITVFVEVAHDKPSVAFLCPTSQRSLCWSLRRDDVVSVRGYFAPNSEDPSLLSGTGGVIQATSVTPVKGCGR